MAKGWVKISRDIIDSDIWTGKEPFDERSAWIDLILRANHEEAEIKTRSGEIVKIPRGGLFVSLRKLAERWHWTKKQVEVFLGTLWGTGRVTLKGTPSGTLVTIVKYDIYQSRRDTKGDTLGDTLGDNLGERTRRKEDKEGRSSAHSARTPREKVPEWKRKSDGLKALVAERAKAREENNND